MGVKRISVGGAFAYCALDALTRAARELSEQGTFGYWEQVKSGAKAAHTAFS